MINNNYTLDKQLVNSLDEKNINALLMNCWNL